MVREFVDIKDYEDDFICHTSLLWYPGNQKACSDVTPVVEALEEEFTRDPVEVLIKDVNIKIGNQLYEVRLKS